MWDDVHDTAFNDIKNALSDNVTTVYYDSRKQTEIIVDASPVDVGAILTQEGKPVAYASRSLTDVEQRYSQTERDAVAVVWGCEHLNIYTEGADSTIIVTDHRPLLGIWLKPNPPLRIARWAPKLQNYNITLQYRCGRENPADYLSRHPVPITTSITAHRVAEDYANYIATNSTPKAMTLDEVKQFTQSDATLRKVIEVVRTGRWHDTDGVDISSVRAIRNELTVSDNDILLRDTRLVIPTALRSQVIQLAHEGHQGITKTKALLRSKVWFPGMDRDTETVVQRCVPCQANSNRRMMEPLKMTTLPRGPWVSVSIDFCGPLPTG